MAESLNSTRRFVFKEPKILVNVDHASDDLLVVSYPYRSKLFQGILIDSTNRYLPCAYPSPEVVKWSPPRVIDIKDPTAPTGEPVPEPDRAFYSLSNRFTYFQDLLFQKNVALIKSAKQAKAKAQKMTVRLRPRQVLCSKCRSICNENSENVRSPSSAKKEEKQGKHMGGADENQNDENKSPRKKIRTTLVPKLSRLEPDDIRELNGRQGEASRVWSEMLEADKQMVLRKKRSVGSMEDLWDETVFEEAAKKAKTTPIIKISFGSPGEGTVLKIPAKVKISGSEGEEEDDNKSTTESSKSLKKAMKKAKKEAKRKISPEREEEPSPEEPNYKKHRHRVKHKKRHKNSKDEDSKEKSLKQKLSISLRRVCGPGEEESWSGESSRSSEPVKDHEDNKSEPIHDSSIHELPSRVISEDTLDSKESSKTTSLEPVETPKRSKRVSSLIKKKMQSTESVNTDKPPDKVLERLSVSETGETSETSKFSKSQLESVRTVKFAQNPSLIKKGSDSNSKSDSYLLESNSLIKVKSSESKHLDVMVSKAECLLSTKDISRVEDTYTTAENEDRIHSVKTKEEVQLDTSVPISEDKQKVELTFKLDDTLDDNLISEDSMPELDETIEDALLESDKEMPEALENQRMSCLNEGWDTEREIPVLTRMVDPEEVKPNKITLRLPTGLSTTTDSKSSSFSTEEKPKLRKTSELNLVNVESKSTASDIVGDQSKNKLDKLSTDNLYEKPEDCLSSIRSQGQEIRLSSDDVADSSEELEFLPAEEYFDETLDGEIPPCPKSSKLLKDRRSSCEAVKVDIPTKCVHSPDPRTYEDCLSPKASLDFELGQYASDLAKPSLDNSFIEVKRSKSSREPLDASLLDKSRALPHHLEKGCEKEKITNPIQSYKPRDSPSPEQIVLASSSVSRRHASCDEVPDIDSHYSSKLPVEKALCLEDNKLPVESKSNLIKDDPSRKCMWKSDTLLVDSLSEISEDESLSITVRDNSQEVVTSETSTLKGKAPSFHPEEYSDTMDTSSPDGCSDSVPNFPESSPRNTPQEVTSCQTVDGSVLSVGDIVWAKIHGFPWWPAKVTRLSAGGSGSTGCDARVAWFGSATSSLMSTDQLSPFIQTFKAKYNRERKSTGYLEAIRQATSEAASSRDFHQPTPLAEIDKLLAL